MSHERNGSDGSVSNGETDLIKIDAAWNTGPQTDVTAVETEPLSHVLEHVKEFTNVVATLETSYSIDENLKEEIEISNNGYEEIPRRGETAALADIEAEEADGNLESATITFLARESMRMARYPGTYFSVALITTLVIAVIGMVVGDFSVSPQLAGWHSRGTLISGRETQVLLARRVLPRFISEGDEDWDMVLNNVQPGWETRRRLEPPEENTVSSRSGKQSKEDEQEHPLNMTDELRRRSGEEPGEGTLPGCNMSWYNSSLMHRTHLWPVWRTGGKSLTALDSEVIRDLCRAEDATQRVLEEKDLCFPCDGGGCLPPYSLVFYARTTVPGGFAMDCESLSKSWSAYQEQTEEALRLCIEDIKRTSQGDLDSVELSDSCPPGFYPNLLDADFGTTGKVEFTSSIFATVDDPDSLFKYVGEYDRGSSLIEGAYDTQKEHFVHLQIEKSLVPDLALSLVSSIVTSLAMLVHTRSLFLTLIGLLQIVLSFPLAYFVYTFVAQLEFFPLLNFIGIFVVFALGADDVFVAVDKWKNARIEHGDASTELVAAVALPDAAGATFLTTLTTAVAFFGTAICPVAPIKCFAIFCGLLVVVDYILCVLLVFPALCMYDHRRHQQNILLRCRFCRKGEASSPYQEEDDEKPRLIRRLLQKFYDLLHRFRWCLFGLCCMVLAVSIYFTTQIELPMSAGIRLLNARDFQYELNYEWRLNLLSQVEDGGRAYVIWGTKAADTGNYNNPNTWSTLVLDEDFDPSNEEVQMYLAGFCDKFFQQPFAQRNDPDYTCPINAFDSWLQDQSQSERPDDSYSLNCGAATSLPVAQEYFDACIVAWNQGVQDISIAAQNGKVRIMFIKFKSRVGFTNSFDELDAEWHILEDWMKYERETVAPAGSRSFYHSSQDFWWYDTYNQLVKATYGAAAIALGMSAAVILFSSRSVMLTVFSVITIGFILCSVTALLVGFGWTLGFIESICFVVLIGISCDFVIHFTHAYAALPGEAGRGERTKYAIVHMGPSILAAAFTTIAAATVMLFTVITFFEKFAIVLLLTILMATLGSFTVFVTLADCFGPSQPTFLVEALIAKIKATPYRNAMEK